MKLLNQIVTSLCLLGGSVSAAEANTTHPNILFLIADDMSWHSAAFAGDPVVKTPNLDKLSRTGVTFTHAAVTTSICMVSRANFLTGRWLSQLGGARVTPENWPQTWPAQLRAAGYHGGHIGKVHVVGQNADGYDFWAGRPGYAWLNDGMGGKIHSIQKDTDEALRFLKMRPKDKPFFLQVAYTVPHAEDGDPKQYLPMPQEQSLYSADRVTPPETAADEFWQKLPTFFHESQNVSRQRWKKRFDTPAKYQSYTKDYFRLISGMDRSIGVILEQLKAQGLADNTVVVFTADNGYFLGEHGLADKWYAYEESLRVPLIVSDPRLPAARRGQQCDDWVLNVDYAPTFCALAGLKPPAIMQGRDITPLVQGQTPADWRTDLLYQFKWGSESIPASEGVCSKDWKYIRWVATNTEELFDLRRDPHEKNDLSKDPAHAADMARLRERMASLKKEVGGSSIEELTHMPNGPGGKKGKEDESKGDTNSKKRGKKNAAAESLQ